MSDEERDALLEVARGVVRMVDGIYEENEDLLPKSPWFPIYSKAKAVLEGMANER